MISLITHSILNRANTMNSKLIVRIGFFLNLFLFCQVALGQSAEDYKGAITFGLTHSINNTNLIGDFPDNSYLNRVETITKFGRFTPDIGINVDFYFSRFLSLQLDAVYSSMGCKVETNTILYNEVAKVEGSSSNRLVLDYIKFPLAINVYPHDKIYFNAGGYFSTLISSQERSFWYDSSDEIEYQFNKIDYGISAGAGLNLNYVKLGFQYNYGLMNTVKDEDDIDLRNGVFQFVVRWKFYSEIRNTPY